MDKLIRIGGKFEVTSSDKRQRGSFVKNEKLSKLALDSLESVTGFKVTSDHALKTLTLNNLNHVDGNFKVTNIVSLQMDRLNRVDGNFYVYANADVLSAKSLDSVNGSFYVRAKPAKDVNFKSLKRVTGKFSLYVDQQATFNMDSLTPASLEGDCKIFPSSAKPKTVASCP